jgi:hypothetical protein
VTVAVSETMPPTGTLGEATVEIVGVGRTVMSDADIVYSREK